MIATMRQDGSYTLGDAHGDFIDNAAPRPGERTVPAVHTSDARVRTDADTWREIEKAHMSGMSMRECADVYGVGYTTIRKHMSNAGIRTKKWLDAEKWTSAEREYRHGATMRSIAKRYGVSLSAVQQHMKRRGIVPMYSEVMA